MAPRLPSLPPHLPGMLALGAYRPDVYTQVAALADNLLRSSHPESTLAPSEREMIATYVSKLNNCDYCATMHGAVAAAHICNATAETLGGPDSGPPRDIKALQAQAEGIVDGICVRQDVQVEESAASPKLMSLLQLAAQVRESGQNVSADVVADAKEHGATDMDIHDTVLIAAMFSMFNRYVDGLTGELPEDIDREKMKLGGQTIANKGYLARREAMK